MTEQRITVAINRTTGQLVGLPSRRITGEEWRRIDWPPCPKCGEPVEADRIDVRQWGDPPFLNYYMPGAWACSNECDLRTP